MLRAGRSHEMSRPLDVGYDIPEPGLLEFEKDGLPVTLIESEVLDFSAEDVFGLVFHV
jgi:hypothetical protein